MDTITLLCLLAGLVNGSLTIYTFFKARWNKVNFCFSLMMLWLTLFVLATFLARFHVIPFTLRLNTSFAPPLAAGFYVFAIIFYGRALLWKTIFLIYLPALVFFALSFTNLVIKEFFSVSLTGVNYSMGPLFIYFSLLIIFYVFGGTYFLVKKFINSDGLERLQTQYILIGSTLFAVLAIAADIILPLLGIYSFNNFVSAASIVFTGFVSYAIFAHRLLNIDIILNKTLLFSLLLSFILLLHFALLVSYQYITSGFLNAGLTAISTFSLLALLLILNPFRRKLQDIVDQMVYGQRYNYQKDIREAASDLIKFHDKNSLLNFVLEILSEKMQIESAAIFLEEEGFLEGEGLLKVAASRGLEEEVAKNIVLRKNAPLIKLLHENKREIIKEELLRDSSYQELELAFDLEPLKVEVCLPLFLRRQIKGVLVLGKRRNKIYDLSDIDLLRILSMELMIALENVLLIEKEKEAASRLAEFQARAKYAEILEEKNKELLKMYKDLKETQEQLIKSERLASISQLSVSLNHEINNPLTSILGHIQLILLNLKRGNEVKIEEIKKFLEQVEIDAKRIKALLLSLRKITEPAVTEYVSGVSMIDLQRTTDK